jgi:hypothetical protein
VATELGHSSGDPADLTAERFKAALYGERDYPRGAVFIDAEASFAWDATVRNVREERPVVLVFPDGLEKVIMPSSPVEREQGGLIATARRLGERFNPTRILG